MKIAEIAKCKGALSPEGQDMVCLDHVRFSTPLILELGLEE
jgi:hypothetical protein